MRNAISLAVGFALTLSSTLTAVALSSQKSSQPIEFFRGVGDNGSHYDQTVGTSGASTPAATPAPAPTRAPALNKTSQPIEFFRGVGDNGSHYGATN
jgi:hypothetical protein